MPRMKKFILPLILVLLLTFTLIGNCDWLAGWDKRIELAINDYAGDIGASVTWFPVTIHLKNANGDSTKVFLEVGANYKKIAITKVDGITQLKGEVEGWSYDAGTPANSTATIHTSAYGWTIDSNTKVYLYYDNDHADNDNINVTDTAAAEAVYDGNFKGVWHMAGTGETAIDVGSACTDRAFGAGGNNTYIDLANVADFTGKITNVAIYAYVSMASAKVATFYVSGGKYTARSASANLGAVASGAVRNFAVNLNVVSGDFLGIYFTDNFDAIEQDTSGGSGIVWLEGDQTACVDTTFSLYAGYAISLYGTGITVNIKDSTSNNNDGIKKGVNEPNQVTGKMGLAQDFDGTNDYISLGDPTTVDGLTAYTFEAWVYQDAYLAGANFILSKDSVAAGGRQLIFCLDSNENNSGNVGVFIWKAGDVLAYWLLNTGLDLRGGWHHIAAGTTADTPFIYIDGESKAVTLTGSLGAILATTTNMLIGARTTSYFDGKIDELKTHDVARSAAWIKGTYNSGMDSLFTYGSEELAPAVGITWNGILITKWNGITITIPLNTQ